MTPDPFFERFEQLRRGHAARPIQRLRRESGGVGNGETDSFQVSLAGDAGDVARVARCRNRPISVATDDSILMAIARPVEPHRTTPGRQPGSHVVPSLST